ncbi:MAG: type II secretion system F family protein [Pirellulaceae bacterium]|nr:type II secretion system F family protein [Planctomycetales bacterium]MCA9225899.1 type II secretion system F family protein [Planctomycetales bacterium]
MLQVTLFFGWLTLVALVAAGWRGMRQRELAWQRLAEVDGRLAPQDPVRVGTRRLHRRWIWAPWALALAVATVVALVFQLSLPYVVALGLMFGLLASQIESFLAARHVAVLETQLADAIDIMIGAVGAGASVGTAIEAAITECRSPLRPYLEEVAGRIRLGDEPAEVFRSLAQRVPLETFLLFTSALSVHWEVGGKLSSTLTTVGRTIRDRIDISRRIRSNTAQSQFSTLAIVGLTYFIAVIVWRNGPDQMEDFVRSPIGSWFVAGSVILQAVGIVWMNLISKPRF